MNGNETKTTESQNIRNNDIPWFKKKNTIIGASSILGVGALVTVITVPIVLTQTVDPVQDTITTLNAEGNKATRIGIWNQYMGTLTKVARAAALDTIVRSPEFITEFISFLTSNLYENEATTTVAGSVSKADLAKIVAEISSTASQEIFKNTTGLAAYTKLFDFSQTTSMFTFKNKAQTATTEFSLFMPSAGLDLIYNTDETISVKLLPYNATSTNNVRLTINTFADPAITSSSPREIYFKADAIIKLPSTVMVDFKSYLKTIADNEVTNRGKIVKSLTDIKTNIEGDATNAKGLSYWNSFALNYATSNNTFLKDDLKKEVTASGMYKFLAANAKKADGSLITSAELAALKVQLIVDNTNGLSANPFVSSPANSNLLFNTSNATDSKYSLSLNITKFSYDFVVNNLFVGANAIVITPKLELSGSLSITPTAGAATKAATTFTIANGAYDVGSLISMAYATEFATGGLTGFFTQLSNPEQNQLSKLTNSLATLNGESIDKQITFWNTFAAKTSTASNNLILAELKKANVLADFILNNIDITNLVGFKTSGGSLPTIVPDTLKASITTFAATLSQADLSFANPGVAAITLTDIVYGSDATNDKFATITIYFGYEANSISNFNITSKLGSNGTTTTGTSNISLSQTVEATTTFTDKAAVEAAAKKRISVVFDKTTTGGTAANASTSVAFFGQIKNSATPAVQVTKPIIISSSILTSATKFIDAISPPATTPAK